MTKISDDKADERKKRIIIHKRQNKNIKVCRRSRADLNNEEGTAESVKGQRAVAPLTLIILKSDCIYNIDHMRISGIEF